MRFAQVAAVARTLARLKPQQFLMRPYIRLAPAVLPRLFRARNSDRGALARFASWAETTERWSREASIAEASRALRGEWMYVGVAANGTRRPLSDEEALDFPESFPSRLWEYEFRYRRWLEGLAQLASSGHVAPQRVIELWHRADRDSVTADFEPYVLARRLWSEATAAGLLAAGSQLPRIDREMRLLRAMPELHIGANHLLAGRASVAALSMLLKPRSSSTVHAIGKYVEELERQIDSDGLHEERSPGYHLVALHDLKRTRAAAEVSGALQLAQRLGAIERGMESALALLLHPGGTLPMFHDSTSFVSPDAAQLGVEPSRFAGAWDLPQSGLCGWIGEADGAPVHLVSDFGSPRPVHQPGHQHAAPFAFELWWDGLWITSAGVSTYDACERRSFERGIAAHAALRIDGREPAELWSAFRMGRGYEVASRKFVASGGSMSISAVHDGYAPRAHRRTIRVANRSLTIEDEVTGNGRALLEATFPLAPGVSVETNGRDATLRRGARTMMLRTDGATFSARPIDVSLRFGEREMSTALVAAVDVALPHAVRVAISFGRVD